MGKPKELIPGDGAPWVRIQYVKYRQVLRLTGVADDGLDPIEIPLSTLFTRLAIEPGDLDTPVRYLLFAGVHSRPRRGTSDLVGAFHSEADARQAFTDLRRERPDTEGWAELAVLDHRGRCSRLAWFGHDEHAGRPDGPGRRSWPWRRERAPSEAAP